MRIDNNSGMTSNAGKAPTAMQAENKTAADDVRKSEKGNGLTKIGRAHV